ncbi:hypothetical protein [Mesorhizobium sp. M1252]|uniref:hypothetical protein n=1 Tax=Mesorhizobium sp. M1252 TaxID=2957073 RepID=UPI00333CEB70
MDKQKVILLLTDAIVAGTISIEKIASDKLDEAERAIKSAYYGLDNALTLIRREIAPASRE